MKKWHLKIVRKVKQEKLSKWSSLFEAEKSNTEKEDGFIKILLLLNICCNNQDIM